MKRITVILISLVVLAVSAGAQIRVDAPSVVGLNEQFNVTFSLTEKPSTFEWSAGDNFQLVWGPQTGSSTSISIVNGKTTRNSQYTYTYILLPKGNGTFNLPAAHAIVDGNDVYYRTPRIEVVSDGASQSQGGQSQSGTASSQQQQGSANDAVADHTARTQNSSEDIFMRFSLSRTSVVVGEPITATLKLYTRCNVSGFEDAKFPTFNGFWSQEIESPQNISFVRESVGDKIFNAAVLRRWVIVPQKTGVINIDPAELVCLTQQRISTGNSIFDGFFDDFQTIRKRVLSQAYKVNVSALPAGAPASFTGAVGSYSIKALMNTDSLKVHDAASLTLTVTGKGNVALVGAPKVAFPPDSEVYDTKTSDRMDAGSGGTSGAKIFEYPFIPRSYGDFEIAPVEFSYYDVQARRYVTLKTSPIPYHVERGAASDYVPADGVAIPTVNQKDVKNLSEDIHYISVKFPQLYSEGRFFAGTPLFIILSILILLLGLVTCLVVSKIRSDRADVAMVRTKSASKLARKRLVRADEFLSKNLYAAFYEELHKALLGYASDKLNMSVADLSKESISEAFASKGAPASLTEEFIALLDVCEFARYSPDGGNAAMKESYDKAMSVISTIDANMKKNHSLKAALLAMLLLPGISVMGQESEGSYPEKMWDEGVEAFSAQDYPSAIKAFSAICDLGLSSPELYTNLADSYFKDGQIAMSVLYYERALKLDPSYKDAKYNLEIAGQSVQDRIESVPEFFLKTWSRKICYSLSSNVWAWGFIAFLALVVAALVLFFLSRTSGGKKAGFFTSLAALVIAVICLVNALWQKRDYDVRDSAIVTSAVCSAKSAPSSSSSSDLFVLHEGTKVKIIDTVGDWYNIILSDGREGWILTRNLTII